MINVMHKGWQKLCLVGISVLFLWSFFLRFYHFGQIPTGLYWDETSILLDAKSVAETGKDMHGRPWFQVIYPSYGDYKLPVYIWLASVSVKFLGANEVALRLPSALAGLATIVISGLLVRELLSSETVPSKLKKNTFSLFDFKNAAAILTSLTVALSPWSILFSRTAFEAHLAQSLLALSLLLAILSRKKPVLILISPIVGVLATYTYFSVRYVWLGAFLLLSILFLTGYERYKTRLNKILTSFLLMTVLPIAIFSVGLLPMFHSPLYDVSNTFRLSTDSVLQNTPDVIQSNVYREMAGNQKIDRVIFYKWWLTGKKLLANYSDNISLNFLFLNGDPNLRHGTGEFGLFSVLLLPFFLTGWYILFSRFKKVFILFLAWWLFALLPASVPNTTPHALRSLNALVPLAGVIGMGLSAVLLKTVPHLNTQLRKAGFSLVLLVVVTVTLFQFTHFYFTEYPKLSATAWQTGYKELAQTTYSMRLDNEPVYVVQFDDRFYLWLLLYGPYSVTQIQNFPENNFQIRDFDQVYTEHIPTPAAKALVVGSSDGVQAFAQANNYKTVRVQKINVPNEIPFVAASMEMKLNEN